MERRVAAGGSKHLRLERRNTRISAAQRKSSFYLAVGDALFWVYLVATLILNPRP